LHVLQGCTEHQDGFGPSHRLPQDLPALAERKPVRSSHLSSGAPRTARKDVVNPLCAVAPASGAPDHAPRATLGINHQLSARAESAESPRCTAHPKPVTCAKFTREVQKPLGIGVQIKQEKPCGARPLGGENWAADRTSARPSSSSATRSGICVPVLPKMTFRTGFRSLVAIAEMDDARGWRKSPRQ
jgi:hypothetical protein